MVQPVSRPIFQGESKSEEENLLFLLGTGNAASEIVPAKKGN
jgi:hypothetical protein